MSKFHVYKLSLILCGAVLSVTALAGQPAQDEIRLTRARYEGKCFANEPLATWERCDVNSYVGKAAMDCAMKEALDACNNDPYRVNGNCAVSAAVAEPVGSIEFLGFRRCLGRAVAFGYQRVQ